ncbi:MAG: TonB-dependent receptor [Acidobacteriota bacterium]
MRTLTRVILVIVASLAVPVASSAQTLGTIAGVARDSTGSVLPGVTVEVASPALIEKVRSVVTDGAGQYTVVSLPVGTYSVTFSLAGFSASKREGIELLANFTASVNAEMKVGAISETITVTSQTPLVDVQSATQSRAVTPDIIKSIPVGGTMYQLAAMMPGVTISGGSAVVDVGGASGSPVQAQLSSHGSATGDEVQLLDGLRIGNMMGGSRTNITLAPLLYEQVDVQISGQGGDSTTIGVTSNAIPRSGGNKFSGAFLINGANSSLQSDNLTQRLKDLGLAATSSLKSVFDVNGALGGPIVRDRLWFYTTGRYQTNTSYVAGLFYPVDQKAFFRAEDRGQQAYDDQFVWDEASRFTASLTPKLRVNGFFDIQRKWWPHWTISAAFSPEAVGQVDWPPRLYQGTFTYAATNRLLVEFGYNYGASPDTILPRDGEVTGGAGVYRVVETGGTFNGQAVAPITYGPFGLSIYDIPQRQHSYRASMSYVTGSHTFKVGTDIQTGLRGRVNANFADDIQLRTTGFTLNQVTIYSPSGAYQSNLDYNGGVYVQDRWTLKRMTFSGALRYDVQHESYDAYTAGPTKYLPTRNLSFPAANIVNWKEINPRAGVSYDVFGNGKTAWKLSIARGVAQESLATADALNPAVSLITSTARTVTDSNNNHIPDCNLFNSALNGECGPWLTSTFGSAVPGTQNDPATLTGLGVRPWNWEFSTGIQHELMPRVSVGLAYYRRINGGFLVTDNIANTAADFQSFPVAVPADSRLPNSGGSLTVYDISPALVAATQNVNTFASNYGNQYRHWNGFDATADVRLPKGTTFTGGVTAGRTMTDNCEVIAKLPELAAATPVNYCHNESGMQPQYKMIGSYMLPGAVRVSGNFQSLPGPGVQAGVIYTGAQLAPALGRVFSAGAAGQKTVNVYDPTTVFSDRLNQIDIRFSKIIKVRGASIDANFDVYNSFNSDAILALTTGYSGVNGGTWLRPTSVIQGRIVKFGMRLDF